MDFSQLLSSQIEQITQDWVSAVRQDSQIEIAQELTYKALRDSLPLVLKAMVTILSSTEEDELQQLVDASLEHGIVRAEQGFDPSEIAREYRLLRAVIFRNLESGLLQGSPQDLFRAVRLIDTVIDEAIARCFSSYTHGRLRELEHLQAQLKLTNQELTRLVRASKENLSRLAHDLKTPLTSIIGYSDLFLRQYRQIEETEAKDNYPDLQHIERVLRSGRQVLHLINDALELARYDAGQMQLHPVPVKVQPLMQQMIEMVEPLAQEKELPLILECDRAPETVVTDPLRLQQIITNLLSNAIRYTETGSIRMTCQLKSSDSWAIAVQDTGVGIDPDDRQRIFDPYFRVLPESQSYLPNSTGLGLAIVTRLVSLMQGQIEVVSQVGIGSTFTVVLPLNLDLSEAQSIPQEQPAES